MVEWKDHSQNHPN